MVAVREKIITVADEREATYNLFVESDMVGDNRVLKFISTWDGAKVPTEEQKKFELLLSDENFKKFKDFINSL